jgi:hypothetical protein
MDDIIEKLKSPDECERLIKNVKERNPELALRARRKAVELRASAYGAKNEAEKEALQAVYAYEEVLSAKRGRRTYAARTWQMIRRHGIIGTVERAVNRKQETSGYKALVEMGMQDFAFEAFIVRYSQLFSPEALAKAKLRMAECQR